MLPYSVRGVKISHFSYSQFLSKLLKCLYLLTKGFISSNLWKIIQGNVKHLNRKILIAAFMYKSKSWKQSKGPMVANGLVEL